MAGKPTSKERRRTHGNQEKSTVPGAAGFQSEPAAYVTEKCALLYRCPTCIRAPSGGEALATHSVGNFARAEVNRKEASSAVRSCAYCGCGPLPAASRCSRSGGAGNSNAAFPALSKGSIALAPRCGYPEVRMKVAACDIHPSHHCARYPRAIHHEGGCCK